MDPLLRGQLRRGGRGGDGYFLCRLVWQLPFPRVLTVVSVLVASVEIAVPVLPYALLDANAVVVAVPATVAVGAAVVEAVILPAAVAAGHAAVVAVIVAPAAAPFAEVAVAAATVAVAVATAASPPRRWLWRWRRSLRLFCEGR